MQPTLRFLLGLMFFSAQPVLMAQAAPESQSATTWRPGAWPAAWPSFRGSPTNQGVAPQARWRPTGKPFGPNTPAFTWAHRTHGLIWGSAVVDGLGRSVVGSADRSVYALDATGRLRWRQSLLNRPDAVVDSAAALHPNGLVVVPGGDGALHAFHAETGALAWRFHAQGASEADHAQGGLVPSFEGNVSLGPDGQLYAGSDDGHLYAVGPDGQKRWAFRTGMMVWSAPCFAHDNSWLAFGSLDGHVYLLRPSDGHLLAKFHTGAEVKASPACDGRGRLVVGNANGHMLALDVVPQASSGLGLKLAWRQDLGSEIYSSAAWGPQGLVVGTMAGDLVGLEANSGRTRWRFRSHAAIAASPVLSGDGVAVVGNRAGKLLAVDDATGRLLGLSHWREGQIGANLDASPAVGPQGELLVGSYDGQVRQGLAPSLSSPVPDTVSCFADPPELGPHAPDGVHWRLANAQGAWLADAPSPWPRHEALRLRLVGWEGGQASGEWMVKGGSVQVRCSPELPLRLSPSSDGRSLVVEPESGLWPAGGQFQLAVTAGVRPKGQGWFSRWWAPATAQASSRFSLTVAPAGPTPSAPLESLGAAGMLLLSPEALDTYTPAALAGQAYVLAPCPNPKGGLALLGLPMLPKDDGLLPLLAPERAFALLGRQEGDSLVADGAFRIAAMGGTIPFQRVRMAAKLNPHGQVESGRFLAVANLLGVQANGQSFSFPTGLLDEVADEGLRLTAVGRFRGAKPPLPPGLSPLVLNSSWEGEQLRMRAGLFPGGHLLAVVTYAPDGRSLGAWGVASVEGGEPFRLKMQSLGEQAFAPGGRLAAAWCDGQPMSLGPQQAGP